MAIAQRLARAKLLTLEALAEAIRARGYRWWVHVPPLGEQGAREVVALVDFAGAR